MAVIDQNVELYNSEDKDLNFTVTSDGTTAVNISGSTISWALAKHPAATALITKSGSIVSGAAGTCKVSLSASDFTVSSVLLEGVFYHELRVRDSSGNDTVVASGCAVINKGLA